MLQRFIYTGALLLATAGTCLAQANILVDNFNTGTGGSTINLTLSSTGSTSQFDSGLTTTIGGQRIARLHHVNGTGTINLNNTVNIDVLGMSLPSSGSIEAHFHLYYGYNSYDASASSPVAVTHSFLDLNTNATTLGSPQFTFDLMRLDVVPSTLFVTLVSARGTGSEAFRRVSLTFNTSVLSSTTVNVTPAQFAAGTGSGTINWADIDQIILETGDLVDSTDLRIDNLRFTAVPEPATFALLGLSGVAAAGAVWYRRRKQAAQLNTVCE